MLKKGQWAVVIFVVGIGLSLYLNWALTPKSIDDLSVTDVVSDVADDELGEAVLVNADNPSLFDEEALNASILNQELDIANITEGDAATSEETSTGANEATVNKNLQVVKADYFKQAQINRQRARDEAIEIIMKVASDEKATDEMKSKAQKEILAMSRNVSSEANIENLVLSKGMLETICTATGDSIAVTVRVKNPLTASQIAQIKDIVLSETNISVDKIKVVEVK